MPKYLFSALSLLLMACAGPTNDIQQEETTFPFYRPELLKLELLKDCEKEVVRYYEIGAKYPESSPSLTKKINSSNNVHIPKNANGYITLHFIVNCKGEVGEFVAYQLDENFKRKKFSSNFVTSLQNFVLELENFKTYKDKNYYYFFTFKTINGQVTEILP